MKRPAIFFDRDNTLIESDGYLGDPGGVKLVDGAADVVARARELGYATIVVSNQSGVARGMFDEAAVHAVNRRMDELLVQENPGAVIDRHEFCPFHPEAVVEKYRRESDQRKPKPGMLLAAADKMALDLPRSWLIGDAPRDVEAGHAAGCRTILFQSPHLARSSAANAAGAVAPDYVVTSLKEAMDFIELHPMEEAAAANRPIASRASEAGGLTASPAAQPNVPPAPQSSAATTAAAPPAAPAKKPVKNPGGGAAPAGLGSPARLEFLLEQILAEVRRRNEQIHTDFSVSKLMAGVVQVIVLAVMFLGYLRASSSPSSIQTYLLLALTLQTMTIALLIMSRQR